jgi:WD40 repeat protein
VSRLEIVEHDDDRYESPPSPLVEIAAIAVEGRVFVAALSADQRVLALGRQDGLVQLVHLNGDLLTLGRTLAGHSGVVTALAFTPAGDVLYSGGIDGTILEWPLTGPE